MAMALDLLQRHHRALALAGLALLVLGSWLTASAYHAHVPVERLQEVPRWTESDSYSYAVPVTRNSTHHPIGSELPMGEPAYFRTISDSIHVTFDWGADSARDFRGLAAARMVVEIHAQTADGRPYWSVEHPLAEAIAQNAREGVHLEGRVDLDALMDEVETLGHELPTKDGVVNWSVRTTVVYALEADEERDQGESEFVLPILENDPQFALPPADALRWSEDHTQSSVVVTSAAGGVANVLASWRGLASLAAGVAALVASRVGARGDPVGRFEREQRRFREWISVTQGLPPSVQAQTPFVDVATLEDLVHVAADARARVLLDARTRVYYALLPGVTYRYAGNAPTGA